MIFTTIYMWICNPKYYELVEKIALKYPGNCRTSPDKNVKMRLVAKQRYTLCSLYVMRWVLIMSWPPQYHYISNTEYLKLNKVFLHYHWPWHQQCCFVLASLLRYVCNVWGKHQSVGNKGIKWVDYIKYWVCYCQDITVVSFTSSSNHFSGDVSQMHLMYVKMSFDDVARNWVFC